MAPSRGAVAALHSGIREAYGLSHGFCGVFVAPGAGVASGICPNPGAASRICSRSNATRWMPIPKGFRIARLDSTADSSIAGACALDLAGVNSMQSDAASKPAEGVRPGVIVQAILRINCEESFS